MNEWWSITSRYYYQAIQVIVSIKGFYKFRSASRIDMYGSLYSGYFDATDSRINRLISDANSSGNYKFYFRIYLQSGNYTLVASTDFENRTGSFSIVVSGPTTVTLQ